jgi:REP element-mobilizing transposase RayT
MPRPPLIAYHLIWTAYGSWLPNDPRGSMSTSVGCDAIAELGELHYGRRKRQPGRDVVREFYQAAADALKYPRLLFTSDEFNILAGGLANGVRESGYMCYAAAIMPDHVHVVIRKHRQTAEEMIARLQGASRLAIFGHKLELLADEHPVWTSGGWKGFLGTPKRVHTTIRYVEQNPVKDGLPAQNWPFVTAYNNWPFHKAMRPLRGG